MNQSVLCYHPGAVFFASVIFFIFIAGQKTGYEKNYDNPLLITNRFPFHCKKIETMTMAPISRKVYWPIFH
jgi:hypothetical protein